MRSGQNKAEARSWCKIQSSAKVGPSLFGWGICRESKKTKAGPIDTSVVAPMGSTAYHSDGLSFNYSFAISKTSIFMHVLLATDAARYFWRHHG